MKIDPDGRFGVAIDGFLSGNVNLGASSAKGMIFGISMKNGIFFDTYTNNEHVAAMFPSLEAGVRVHIMPFAEGPNAVSGKAKSGSASFPAFGKVGGSLGLTVPNDGVEGASVDFGLSLSKAPLPFNVEFSKTETTLDSVKGSGVKEQKPMKLTDFTPAVAESTKPNR